MKAQYILVFLTGLYLALWHGGFSNVLMNDGNLNFIVEGLGLAVLCFTAGAISFFRLKTTKRSLALAAILNIIAIVAFAAIPSIALYFVVMVFQGYLLSAIILWCRQVDVVIKAVSMFIMGAFAAFVYYLISPYLMLSNNDLERIVFYSLVVGVLLIQMLTGIFAAHSNVEDQRSHGIENFSIKSAYPGYIMLMLLIVIEVSLFTWALVLRDESQSLYYRITLPITLLLVFLVRFNIPKIPSSLVNKGWLFVMMVILTISSGFFYTFEWTFVFIVLFSVSIVTGGYITSNIYALRLSHVSIGVIFLILGISMAIAALYIDNHIEYILSLKMPKNLLNLSAQQAWIKELTSLSGLAIVLSGIIYLKSQKKEIPVS